MAPTRDQMASYVKTYIKYQVNDMLEILPPELSKKALAKIALPLQELEEMTTEEVMLPEHFSRYPHLASASHHCTDAFMYLFEGAFKDWYLEEIVNLRHYLQDKVPNFGKERGKYWLRGDLYHLKFMVSDPQEFYEGQRYRRKAKYASKDNLKHLYKEPYLPREVLLDICRLVRTWHVPDEKFYEVKGIPSMPSFDIRELVV